MPVGGFGTSTAARVATVPVNDDCSAINEDRAGLAGPLVVPQLGCAEAAYEALAANILP